MSKDTPLQQILLKLKSAFPDAITETQKQGEDGKPYYEYALKEDFVEQLQGEGLDIADDQNRYELQFPGKQLAKAQVFAPNYKTLVADKQQSKNFNDTGNVFIEGDNLDALRILQKSYRGKIKMIYIDPPYNTGGDGFSYNDDFSTEQKKYLQSIGVLDEEGVRQISQVQDGLCGRFHAGWLAMIYPRLKLARELLSEDGVIFISIDDNEQANLKLICDEIYGEDNFIGNICWNSTKSVTNTALLSVSHNNIYIYAKEQDYFVKNRSEFRLKENGNGFANPDNDPRGLWKADPFQVGGWRPNQQYEIKNPNTDIVYIPNDGCSWKNDYKAYKKLCDDNRIVFGASGEAGPSRKRFLFEAQPRGKVSKTWWDDVGTTTNGTQELKKLFDGTAVFSNPKPTSLINKIIQLGCPSDGIILDFFAGSATTAHAVMQLNAEDRGKRKFVLVQWAEKIDVKKSQQTYNFCKNELRCSATIAEISKERIRRAGDKILADNPDKEIDTGFRVFNVRASLLSSNDRRLLAHTEPADLLNYKRDLKRENFERLLYEALLYTAIPLDLPVTVREIESYPFALCNRYCYCVTENLTQKIVQAIAEQYGDQFGILYYLSDCPKPTTSYTELESAIRLAGDKDIQPLNFY